MWVLSGKVPSTTMMHVSALLIAALCHAAPAAMAVASRAPDVTIDELLLAAGPVGAEAAAAELQRAATRAAARSTAREAVEQVAGVLEGAAAAADASPDGKLSPQASSKMYGRLRAAINVVAGEVDAEECSESSFSGEPKAVGEHMPEPLGKESSVEHVGPKQNAGLPLGQQPGKHLTFRVAPGSPLKLSTAESTEQQVARALAKLSGHKPWPAVSDADGARSLVLSAISEGLRRLPYLEQVGQNILL